MNMELEQISNRVYYLPAEEPTDRPALGYIKGDRLSLAVDAGNSAGHVNKFYRALKERNLRLPDFTVLTHWHWDHTFAMHAVSGRTAAGHLTNRELEKVQRWQWTGEAMAQRLETGEDIELCDRCIKLEYPDRNEIKVVRADIEFTGAMNLYLGGIRGEIREFIAPHSDDSVLVYIPEERIIFIGDADSGDYYHNNGRYDRARLHALLTTLEELDADVIFSSHDAPRPKREYLKDLKRELPPEG